MELPPAVPPQMQHRQRQRGQLQHRGLTLAQIADRLGYEDPGALSRALQRLARREPAA